MTPALEIFLAVLAINAAFVAWSIWAAFRRGDMPYSNDDPEDVE